MMDVLRKVLAPIQRRIMLMVARGVVKNVKDGKLQKVQITALADEVLDGLEYTEPYGFTSVPEAGAEAVALFLGGNRDHGIVIQVADRRYRLSGLASGDVAIYHKSGSKIVLKSGGKVQIYNGTNELISVLSDLVGHLIDLKTLDPLSGPQGLMPDVISNLTADKGKVDSFKV